MRTKIQKKHKEVFDRLLKDTELTQGGRSRVDLHKAVCTISQVFETPLTEEQIESIINYYSKHQNPVW